jgi:hypothetical protein
MLMRTDLLKLSALALGAVLAAAPAWAQADAPPAPAAAPSAPGAVPNPPAVAQARRPDTLGPATAPAAPVAAGAEGPKISFNGLTVPRGKTVEGDVVAPFGDVRVEGEVTGNVTVGKGNLILADGGVIRGDAVVNGGGQLINEGGHVYGEMRVNSGDEADEARADAEAARAEAREEAADARREAREAVAMHRHGFMGSMRDGAEGLVSTLTLALILCLVGAGLVFYALPQLERVSTAVRRDTARSVGVGIAAHFLSLPAFIVGIVVLAVTIIGIPLLILWVPLFWVAIAAAAGYGVVAVAHAIGERTAEQSGTFAASRRNAYTYVFTGIGVLMAPFVAGHLLQLTGFLGWLGGLVEVLATLILWAAATVGFGAVFLTRGGTRTGWPWKPRSPAYDPIFDEEPAFDRAGAGAHV